MLHLAFALFSLVALIVAPSHGRSLLVISVDGMDHRYLRDADRLGLRIPNLRRLRSEGAWAAGVVGEVPTVTWPSHTTMITGVAPHEHGILSNRRPASDGGDYYWDASLLKAETLWQAARKAGLKTAAITWPVTVGAAIDFNLPEVFAKRNGGGMDLATIRKHATPGLVEKITQVFPSFPQEWVDDRTRTLATLYLLQHEKPDLILLHLVDLDAAAHAHGPFTPEANAILEYSDELIGQMTAVAPPGMAVAVVSDHGFERVDREVDLEALLAKAGVPGRVELTGGLALARNSEEAAALRRWIGDSEHGIGREVGSEELARFLPSLPGVEAAFESLPHVVFGRSAQPEERGIHGLWPLRAEYRASFLLWGRGIKPERLPEMSLREHARRFAEILGISLPARP